MKINNILSRIFTLLLIVTLLSFSLNVYAEEVEIPEVSESEEFEDPYMYENEEEEEIEDPYIYETEEDVVSEETTVDDEIDTTVDESFTDRLLISHMQEYDFLKKMGMLLVDTEQSQNLSREKAAMYFASLYDIEALPQASITYFKDVSLENQYLSYINYGCEYGYISGTGDGNFSPKSTITISEFATVILRIGGYRNYIQAKGGTLSQIMLFADRYNLLDGISAGYQDIVTEHDALIMLSNALNMPVCNSVGVQGSNIVYDVDSNYTLLEQNFEVKKEYGVICAVYDAALPGYSKTNENLIVFSNGNGNNRYSLENFNADKFLGQEVYCYVKDDKVIYIEAQHTADSLILNSGDYTFSSDRTRVSRENEKGKTREEKIAYDAVFVYNGKQCNNITSNELNSLNTRVELVNIDSDSVYEIVYVEHNVPMVVEALPDPIYTYGVNIDKYDSLYPMYPDELVDNLETNPAYTSYVASERTTGKSIELDVNSDEYRLTLLKNGKEIKYSDIKTGDLLSVCESKDGEKRTVYVSSNREETTVSQLDYSNNKIVVASGNEYTYTFNLPDSPILGKSVILYIDVYGYASSYRFADTGEIVYGYLLAYGGNNAAFTKNWKAKMYTMDKKILVYDFAEKFFQNDIRTDGESFKAYFDGTGHQLVKYMLNGEGKIKRIYTSTEPQGYELHKDKPVFVMNEHYNGDTENYGLYKSSNIEQEYSPISAKRLNVIVDDNGNVIDDRVYLVTSFKADMTHDLKVYDAQTGKIAKFLVNTIKESEIETYNSMTDFFFVIEDIRVGLDGKFLYGMSRKKGNKPFSYHFYEGSSGLFNGLKSGDVIKIVWYETDENGNYVVSDYEKMFTLESNGTEDMSKTICADYEYSSDSKPITDGRISYNKQMYGTILAMASGSDPNYDIEYRDFSVVLQPEGTSAPEDCYVFSYSRENQTSFKLFRYDTERRTLKYEDGFDLKPGDKIFVATNWYSASFIVIYE